MVESMRPGGEIVLREARCSSYAYFENAPPQLPRPESSAASGQAEKKLGGGGYTLTSDRREMVTVAMRNGFAATCAVPLALTTGEALDYRLVFASLAGLISEATVLAVRGYVVDWIKEPAS
jgi:hypothetical protein